jgi:hypothetical protein
MIQLSLYSLQRESRNYLLSAFLANLILSNKQKQYEIGPDARHAAKA